MSDQPSTELPPDLPPPEDDGAAEGLAGRAVPAICFETTTGEEIDLAAAAEGRVVVYVYPRTGIPGEPDPPGWKEVPGAFGCTAENCAFRDHAEQLETLGAKVLGLSSQPLGEQREFAARTGMLYPLLNDSGFALAAALDLPTFEEAGMRLYRRLTFVAHNQEIDKVFYPVFPPDAHPAEVLAWLGDRWRRPSSSTRT
jgi:peroxiredoxin